MIRKTDKTPKITNKSIQHGEMRKKLSNLKLNIREDTKNIIDT